MQIYVDILACICIYVHYLVNLFNITSMQFIKRIQQVFSVPKYSATFTAVNLLLGVGPIIIPAPFYQAGFILSITWMLIIIAISYNAAMYVAESMSKLAYIEKKNHPERESLIENEENYDSYNSGNGGSIISTTSEATEDRKLKVYDHVEQFRLLYGENWKYLPSIIISVYLTGVSISKCIMTAKTLSGVFVDISVLSQFEFWLAAFFISGAVFSFKSIEKTKVLQVTIIIVRFISILMMIGGAIAVIIMNGQIQPLAPTEGVFNIQDFGDIFSSLIFSFLFHHSIPGITKQLKNTAEVSFFIKRAFLISVTTLIIIPFTGIMAFGSKLGAQHQMKYYNTDFKGVIDPIYYFTSFYVFLNVAAFSVYIIIIRSNYMAIAMPDKDPNKLSKATSTVTAVLITCIVLVSYFLKDQIEVAIGFTGGIFGSLILFLLPGLEVYQARKKMNLTRKNYIEWLPIFVMVIGFILTGFNLYQLIYKLID